MAEPIVMDFFRGEAPKFSPRLLPAGYAQQASNCKLFDGKLKPWNGMLQVAIPQKSGTLQTIYAMRDPSTGDLVWLEWLEDVSVVDALISGDTTQRIVFAGYGAPKATNHALATSGSPRPKDWWRLGVPAPITAPSLATVGGGTGVARDRVYLVTFIHVWADGKTEESASCPPSDPISAKSGEQIDLTNIPRWVVTPTSITRSGSTATVTIPSGHVNWFGDKDRVTIAGADQIAYNGTFEITRLSDTQFTYPVAGEPATPATGTITVKTNHDVQKKRIYRTVIGNAGAFFRFVAEINESVTSYSDSATDTTVALNEAIPSLDWDMPPLDLKKIVDMGNGILAGLSGNQVCFSEPYFAHAWPEKYRRTLPFDGVAAGVVGSSLVVGTAGTPVVYTGSHPAAMAENKLTKINHPCLSARGMSSLGFAVIYPSPEGAVAITEGGTSVATLSYHDRDTWKNVFPETIRAFQFADRYFAAFTSGKDEFGQDTGGAIILDRENNIGGLATLNLFITAGFYDKRTGELYVVHDDLIKKWDADTAAKLTMGHRSREFVLAKPGNYGACKIDAEFELTEEEIAAVEALAAQIIAVNTAINGTAQAGTTDTLTLAAHAPAALPANSVLRLPAGPGSVQDRPVSAYDGGTKVATVSPRWRTNRALHSEAFDNAAWSLRGGGTLTVNAATSPDGTTTAEKLANVGGYVAQAFTFAASTTYTISYHVKAVASDSLFRFGTLKASDLTVNISSGTATSVWQRFSHTFTTTSTPEDNQIYIQNLGAEAGIYIWGAQLEVNSALGDYIKTEASAITLPDATTEYEVRDETSIPEGETGGDLNGATLNEFALNGSALQTPPDVDTLPRLDFTFYAAGELKFSKTLTSAKSPFRMPAGYKEDTVEVGLAGNVVVHRIVIGETMKELRRV